MVADGQTSLPDWAMQSAKRIESAVAEGYAQHAQGLALLDQASVTYQHSTGIDAGYGFFAPAVPNAAKLVFEIIYEDGSAEYELPIVNNGATGLRLSTFLFQLTHTQYDALRELIMRMLAYNVWQRHPTARKIRAVVGVVRVSPPSEARGEDAAAYQFQYAYDFSFSSDR